jgi:hypothetical protein
MLIRYLSWEMLAIHAFTGALFAVITVVIYAALLPDRWPVALALLPLATFSWWGWYAEGAVMLAASRAMRRSQSDREDKQTG